MQNADMRMMYCRSVSIQFDVILFTARRVNIRYCTMDAIQCSHDFNLFKPNLNPNPNPNTGYF